jgi:hypothetical protein
MDASASLLVWLPGNISKASPKHCANTLVTEPFGRSSVCVYSAINRISEPACRIASEYAPELYVKTLTPHDEATLVATSAIV